ncbi:MAG: pilus (MSHA type) biogenesis protein MshL [Gammaproteobacteria bacterium]|nr:pilus (MSHA type) biogenesis protein MshL [Gammaproteobacteria bacterium]
MRTILSIIAVTLFLAGCAEIQPEPLAPSAGHISADTAPPKRDIPALVQQPQVLPEPEAPREIEKYTVVVNEVPVKELLFALARDAKINVDIHPSVEGVVTINAVEQTLEQLLDRVARQVDLRYEFNNGNLLITPDAPYIRTYNVGYLNLARETQGTVTVSTQIASTSSGDTEGGGAGGGNTSTTSINSESKQNFWENLEATISAMLSVEGNEASTVEPVVVNPDSGIVSVRATAKQHAQVQEFIDQVLESVRRQVLIQATVVEVSLSDQFQAGIDWSAINLTDSGFSIGAGLLGGAGFVLDEARNVSVTTPGLSGPPTTSSANVIQYSNPDSSGVQIDAAISLLSEFGNTKVLSSPQIMVLNNHTAVLKVVENFVYFEVEQELQTGNAITGTGPLLATTTTAKTIPVGLVMTVTPQISRDESVTLNVRPTISSVIRTELDPNPGLVLVENRIPVVRVREMESILKVNSRQIAVLGGLMQDTVRTSDRKTPLLADVPVLGNLFKARDQESLKTELVIFMRPVVIKDASIDGDLIDFKPFLKQSAGTHLTPTGSSE